MFSQKVVNFVKSFLQQKGKSYVTEKDYKVRVGQYKYLLICKDSLNFLCLSILGSLTQTHTFSYSETHNTARNQFLPLV